MYVQVLLPAFGPLPAYQVQVCRGLQCFVWAFDENRRTSKHRLLGVNGMCWIIMWSCSDIQSRKTEFLRICFPLPSPPKEGSSVVPLIFYSLKYYICKKDGCYIVTFLWWLLLYFGGEKNPVWRKVTSFLNFVLEYIGNIIIWTTPTTYEEFLKTIQM